jgi:uncharacterized membrane protein YqjE
MSEVTPKKNPVSGIVNSIADLAGDLLEIFELQIRLASKDAKEAMSSGVLPSIALAIGMCLMVAALPVLAFSLAKLVRIQFETSEWVAELAVGGSMTMLAIIISFIAIRKLKNNLAIFGRSTSELSKNIAWLKSVARRDDGQN